MRKKIMEELHDNAYTFQGIRKRFPSNKTNELAEELILLAFEGKLDVKYGGSDIYFIMKEVGK